VKTPTAAPAANEILVCLRQDIRERMESFTSDLAELVAQDSGSGYAAGIRRIADFFEKRLRSLGAEVLRVPVGYPSIPDLGDVVIAIFTGTGTSRTILCGHMDTVFGEGEAAARPLSVDAAGIANGPGVSDDKGGALAGLYALEALAARGLDSYGTVAFVLVPDEEIGSPGSQKVVRELAATMTQALCLECARENGDLVIARKGVADLVFTVEGRAAHAGIEPERGASAAITAAGLALDLQVLAESWTDVTLNVGVINAGTQPNVVAASATIVADLRASDPSHFEAAIEQARMLAQASRVPGTATTMEVSQPAIPWSTRRGDAELAARAQQLALALDFRVGTASTGGSADANHLSAIVPAVLDGLGPVGGNDHSEAEWLDLRTVPDRAALLAALILDPC
jgi:glutamate carboxypeptidase